MWSVRDLETNKILQIRDKTTKEECLKELIEFLSPDLDENDLYQILMSPTEEKEELIRNFGYEVFEHKNPIISVEELVEKAWDWWHDECDYATKEQAVLDLYMEEMGIDPDEVDW